MTPFYPLSTDQQLASHIKQEIANGTLHGTLPGAKQIASTLGVSSRTVNGAVKQLESEGWIKNQGSRRRYLITEPRNPKPRSLTVTILMMEDEDAVHPCVLDTRDHLIKEGHIVNFSSKTLTDLNMNITKVKQMVKRTETDAWIVMAGTSEILEWFTRQPIPAFALFGRFRDLTIAGAKPNLPPVFAEVVNKFVERGHQRICLLAHSTRRIPEPGATERAFLKELESNGIATGPYNLPNWEQTLDGFHRCLEELFRYTPPTALLIDDISYFVATLLFLTNKNIRVPEDVSVVCTKDSLNFEWCNPSVAHIRWPSLPIARQIVKWVNNQARGIEDNTQRFTKAEFVDGQTLGRAK